MILVDASVVLEILLHTAAGDHAVQAVRDIANLDHRLAHAAGGLIKIELV